MNKLPTFEISFRLTTTNAPAQKMRIQATDSHAARRIFEQQNPGARMVSSPVRVAG